MVKLDCPFQSCNESVDNSDKEIAIALFNAHVGTHTVASRSTAAGSNVSSRSEKRPRPKLAQDA